MAEPRIQVVPAVLAPTIDEYNQLMAKLSGFAPRLSLDLSDGQFAPTPTISLIQAHWPRDLTIDIHLMYQHPAGHLETLVSRHPSLVVIHAEASGDLESMVSGLQAVGIKAGLALLPATQPSSVEDLVASVDHALIFGGELGAYGGRFDQSLLPKVDQLRQIKPGLEIAWDGGVNPQSLPQIRDAGVDVVNVGGFIAKSDDPKAAYQQLLAIAEEA